MKWLLLFASTVSLAAAQLTGHTGPTSASSAKRKTICNVLNYGGSNGSRDIGPAILSAYNNCVLKNSGSTLYIPPGNYDMATWVTLSHGTTWALQIDGTITRTSTAGGNLFAIQSANDFEMYSSTSKGAIQGAGYQCRNNGPRLLRIIDSTNYSLHDLIFVDSPEFHVALDTSTNAEIYNLAIRGADIGGSDGIDVWGNNIWIHDVEVSNRDECVTVKSPSSGILIEQIFCNQSGGSAMGSLGSGTAIENIVYRYIYTVGGNQMYMIKSNGGSGYVKNVVFDNFIGLGTAYGLYIDQYWESALAAGNGVEVSGITFSNWNGYITDGNARSAISLLCADGAPCTGITLTNVNMWSSNGVGHMSCESAYGSGACLKGGSGGKYAEVTTSYNKPGGYSTPQTLAGTLSQGFSATAPIPIPNILTTYFPGRPQISPLASNGGGGGGGGGGGNPPPPTTSQPKPTSTSSKPPTSTTPPGNGGGAAHYGQCGGTGWTGPKTCVAPYKCTYSSAYYSQCL